MTLIAVDDLPHQVPPILTDGPELPLIASLIRYPTLQQELYPIINLLLADAQLRSLLIGGRAPPPPPYPQVLLAPATEMGAVMGAVMGAQPSSQPSPFASGLLQMLLEGLRAAGWWGPKQRASAAESDRRHLLPEAMHSTIISTLRYACAVHASTLLPTMTQIRQVPTSGFGTNGLASSGAVPLETALRNGPLVIDSAPLLEALCLLIPALYQLVADEAVSIEGQRLAFGDDGIISQRLAFEPLAAAAAVVDLMLGADAHHGAYAHDGAPHTAPSMARVLERFFMGEFGGGRAAASELLAQLCHPLFAAYLPSHSDRLAQMLTRLLHAGPVAWEEPLMLLVAHALQHPQSPSFVDQFHHVIHLCTASESEAALYCLGSAMQAATRAGDVLTSVSMGQGKPFDEIANLQFYQQERKVLETTRDVLPALAAVLASLERRAR